MKELSRQFRTIDMMLSMHSLLRDKYRRRALGVDILLLVLSFIITATIFLDPSVLLEIQVDPEKTRLLIGICSALVFIISIVSLKVNWKGNEARHDRACDVLINLKNECRDILESEETQDENTIASQCQKCNIFVANLPKIPDRMFNRLKAYHLKKVELSKLLSAYPRTPFFLLRLKILWLGVKDFFMNKATGNSTQ